MKEKVLNIVSKWLIWAIIIILAIFLKPYEVWKYDWITIKWTIPEIFQEFKITEKEIENKKITTNNLKTFEVIKLDKRYWEIEENHNNTQNNTTIKKIPEKQIDSESEDRINFIAYETYEKKHGVWDNIFSWDSISSLQKICIKYQDICDITYFNGTFDSKELLYYQALIIYAIKNIDKNLHTTKKLKNTLHSVRLNNPWEWKRWYAWHNTISINIWWIQNYKEFQEVLTHELWHIIDLWIIRWKSKYKDSKFTEFWEDVFGMDDKSINFYKLSWKSENTKFSGFKDFVGWYAMTNPFEDFAESFNMYLNHHEVFKNLGKTNYTCSQKFQYIDSLFKWFHFHSDNTNLKKLEKNQIRRPWDSTKI
jgi:predicted SprT family Zn-dependent metalloprotease